MLEIFIIIGLIIAVPYGIGNAYLLSRNDPKFNMVVTWLLENENMNETWRVMLLGLIMTIATAIGIIGSFILAPLIIVKLLFENLFIKLFGGKRK